MIKKRNFDGRHGCVAGHRNNMAVPAVQKGFAETAAVDFQLRVRVGLEPFNQDKIDVGHACDRLCKVGFRGFPVFVHQRPAVLG